MFDTIINNPTLFSIMRGACSDEGLTISFADDLLNNGEIDDGKVLILKPDEFYSSRNMHNPPSSVDCLIIVRCQQHHYDLYLVELRDVTGTPLLKYDDIVKKFRTMVDDFFVNQSFSVIFNNITYGRIKFYLVTNPFRCQTQQEFNNKVKSSALDAYSSRKPLVLFNKPIMIEPVMSTTTIVTC